jgi:diguanylate cyclase (GGDEF)-like protein
VARIRAAIASGRECRELLLNVRGPGREPWWNEVHLSPVRDGDGRVVQYIGVQTDVTERVRAERALRLESDRARSYLARIEELAWTDPLTGLLNRRRIEERVELELWEARAGDRAAALLFLDLDGFKPVNDTFGHAAGDDLLRTVAQRLRSQVRGTDLLARLGGDEFLVAVTGLDPARAAAEAGRIADALRRAVSRPVEVAGTAVSVTASIGISVFPGDGEEFGRLLHLADMRMYALKHPRG